MSTYKDKVQEDVEYIEKYNPAVDHIDDKGRLTLVNERFIPWAKCVGDAVNIEINQQKSVKRN